VILSIAEASPASTVAGGLREPSRSVWRGGAYIFASDPSLDYPLAAPIWSAGLDPTVISAVALPCGPSTPLKFQIDRYDHCVAIGGGVEHVFFRCCGTSLRLDVIAGTVLAGAVTLEPGLRLDRIDSQIDPIHALAAILRLEKPPDLRDARLPRLVLALRAIDARREGASLRDIARGLFEATDWPGDGDHIKSRARRLVTLSERLWQAGPAGVLTHVV